MSFISRVGGWVQIDIGGSKCTAYRPRILSTKEAEVLALESLLGNEWNDEWTMSNQKFIKIVGILIKLEDALEFNK